MVKLNNPFVVYGYKGAEFFCDREAETHTIMSALHNERNIALTAPRRMGKSGLIQHVFNKITEEDPDVHCFYIDILSTRNLQKLVQLMSESIIGKLDSPSQTVIKRIQNFFKGLHPSFTFDEITGMPTVSLDFQPSESRQSLHKIFEYMRLSGKRCYVAFDEFQQILTYKDENVEALLRSYIQFLPNVYFIFSGSIQHLIQEMFSSSARPFFQSSQMLDLKPLDFERYHLFANKWFAEQGRNISQETFKYVFDRYDGITWYVQAVMNRLYEWTSCDLTIETCDEVIKELTNEQEGTFQNYCSWLTDNQLQLIQAIAAEGGVESPLAINFIRKYALPSTSSVSQALQSLLEKRLLSRIGKKYIVSDLLFGEWLNQKG